ncbi:MAG TPA: sugar phosphate nucleotidyltransferase, partial [Gemmatimonadales bacterium]
MNWVVILAGGSGTRFWPLSSPAHPKQLLPLAEDRPSAVAAVAAVEPLVPRDRILVVTGAQLAGPLQDALGLPGENFLVEPRAASTAPALVWASHEAQRRDPDAAILSMHADWHLGDGTAFRVTASKALAAARAHDALVTVGVVPTREETGYGYLIRGAEVGDGVYRVQRFTEKPDLPTVRQLLANGAVWNSGLFAWTAARLLKETEAHTPEVAGALVCLTRGDVAGYFSALTPVSIDVGLLERSQRVLMLPAAFPWDDIGTWEALARVRRADPAGNVAIGPVHLLNTENCVVWSDGLPVVLSGVHDLVVVHANGRLLVLDRGQAANL